MRVSTIPIAITLALAPVPALPFDHNEFCAALTDIASRMNTRKDRWLDRSTRNDGVKLNCELKTVEVMRFVDAEVEEMRQGWEIRRQREWNAHYCSHESWREAITPAGASSRRSHSARENRSRSSRSVSDGQKRASAVRQSEFAGER